MKFVELTRHQRCTSIHFSIQPTRTPVCDGWPGTRADGRSFSISHAIQVRRFIHLDDTHSKQWAALNVSSLWACLIQSFGRVIELLCTLFFVRIWQPAACGILFVNQNRPWTAVFIQKPTETYHNGNRHSTDKNQYNITVSKISIHRA